MVTKALRVQDCEILEIHEISGRREAILAAIARIGNRGAQAEFVEDSPPPAATMLTRRERIAARIPSAADLDLIVIDPPAEWE